MKTSRLLITLGIGILVTIPLSVYAQTSWTRLNSAAGRFTALMPGKADFSVRKVDTQVGKVDLNAYTATYKQAAFLITYSDYPAAVMAKSDPKNVLRGAMKGATGTGKLVSEQWTTLQGYNAVVFSALKDKTGTGYKWRFVEAAILAKNRLYQIMIIQPSEDKTSLDVKKFFDAFQITK